MKTVSSMILIASILLDGCNCDTERKKVTTSLYHVFFEAVSRPETFDQYVLDNPENFNDNFFKCLDARRNQLDPEYEAARKECDAYIQVPEIWSKCKNDAYIVWENSQIILNALEAVGKGTVTWSSTGIGQQLINMKALDPEFWNYMVESVSALMTEANYCEISEEERGFLCF